MINVTVYNNIISFIVSRYYSRLSVWDQKQSNDCGEQLSRSEIHNKNEAAMIV